VDSSPDILKINLASFLFWKTARQLTSEAAKATDIESLKKGAV
jgi:hypothetical protein